MLSTLATPTALRRAALASVVANVGIVITGGAVRLTGSGLGCTTWPSCSEDSYITTPALGNHGAIEFGNRTLTGVVGLIAVLGVVCALLQRPRDRRTVTLSTLILLGIPAQAVVGGITVLTDLNPWVVACHFLVSMGVIAAAYAFWTATRSGPPATLPRGLRGLVAILTTTSAAVLVVGTIVTGSGPHAGDENAHRTGLDPAAVSQVHADLVFLLSGLAIATWFALRATGARAAAVRAGWLIATIAAQGVVGAVQYATDLPAVLVGLHMAGACAVWIATLSLATLRTRTDAPGTGVESRPMVDAASRSSQLP